MEHNNSNITLAMFKFNLDGYDLSLLSSSVLGLVSQIICVIIFQRIRDSSTLFTYLLAYSANNSAICALNVVQFVYKSFLTNSYVMNIIMARFIVPALAFSYLNGVFLDFLTLADRFSVFNQTIKSVMSRWKPERICLTATLSSLIIIVPSFFVITVQQNSVNLDNTMTKIVWNLQLSPALRSMPGLLFIGALIFLSDVFLMLNQFALSIGSIFYIKRHIRKKLNRSQEVAHSIYHKADLRSTLMVGIMCLTSLFEHLLVLYSDFFIIFQHEQLLVGQVQVLTAIYISACGCLDLLVFLLFNTVFKKEALKIVMSIILSTKQ